jgi:hypothetical protein
VPPGNDQVSYREKRTNDGSFVIALYVIASLCALMPLSIELRTQRHQLHFLALRNLMVAIRHLILHLHIRAMKLNEETTHRIFLMLR